jgi:hypothetical protein
LTGRRDESVAELERLLTTARERYVSAYDVATIGVMGVNSKCAH